MNKPSELLAALEQDQENALERFYKEWDEVVNSNLYEHINLQTCSIRVLPVKNVTFCCVCPIIAVDMHRYGLDSPRNNGDYRMVGTALGLSHAQIRGIVNASDGWAPDPTTDPYYLRLVQPIKAKEREMRS